MALSKSTFLSVLVFLIASFTFIELALASWLQNRILSLSGPVVLGINQATIIFVPITLISAVVGIASILAASNRIKQWSKDGLSGADGATILIDLLLSLLALGFACKEIDIENDLPSHHRDTRVQTLEAFVIIVAFFKVIKLVTLHTDVTHNIFAAD